MPSGCLPFQGSWLRVWPGTHFSKVESLCMPRKLSYISSLRSLPSVLWWALAVVSVAVGCVLRVIEWQDATVVSERYRSVGDALFLVAPILALCALRQRAKPPQPLANLWRLTLWMTLFSFLGWLGYQFGPTYDPLAVSSELRYLSLGIDVSAGKPLGWAISIRLLTTFIAHLGLLVSIYHYFGRLIVQQSHLGSSRAWRIFSLFVFMAVLLSLGRTPTSIGFFVGAVFQGLAILSMLGVVFRVSWIAFLPLKQKLFGILLALYLVVLITTLNIADIAPSGIPSLMPGNQLLVGFVSTPVVIGARLFWLFGLLYATTLLLALFFHLPTTQDIQKRVGEYTSVQALAQRITEASTRDDLYKAMLSSVTSAGLGDAAWLLKRDELSTRYRLAAVHDIPSTEAADVISERLVSDLVQTTMQPIPVGEGSTVPIGVSTDLSIRRACLVPLRDREGTLGVLVVARREGGAWTREELDTMSLMGAQVSLALSNAAYVSTRVAQERASRELQIAHDVQKRLLPQSIVPLAGFDIAGSSAAAREVGGDYFDVLPLSDHEIGFVVADVSGNGTSAAFYMAELQGMIRATASLLPSPAALLAQINRAMSGVLSRNVFITAVYGRLSDRGQVSLARAGHNPPIILRADGEIEAVSPPGAGIGVLRDQRFEDNLDTVTLSLAPGDLMAIYTDGIVEARNAEGEEYDIQRLTAVLCRNAASSSSAIHDAVLRDVASFTGLDVVQDDQTLLVIKRMSPTN